MASCLYTFHSPTRFLMVVCLSFRYSSIHVCSMSTVYVSPSMQTRRWPLDGALFTWPFFISAGFVLLLLLSTLRSGLIVAAGLLLPFPDVLCEISACIRTTASRTRCRYVSYTSMKPNSRSLCCVGLRSGDR